MAEKTAKELMLPISEYAVISEDATLLDALKALDQAQVNLLPDRQPHRAVLITNKDGKIIGKLGHLGFLKALEPKYSVLGDVEHLAKSGLSSEFINSMMSNYRFWSESKSDICSRACNMKIKQVMHAVEESIDENSSLPEIIHQMVMWQTLSILVTRNKEVVGILRLSDLFTEVADIIKSSAD
ncbi:MAG: CBS domain-containing protein [Candidatus Hatepunaea meridiana]|nr:CBS domain-containing protein [Candidatus Hatepunaea meridiana]